MRALLARAEARHLEAVLMSAAAASMPVSVASQEQLQSQHYQQEPEIKPNSQPKKPNAACTYVIEIADDDDDDDVKANYPTKAHRDDTAASQPALQKFCRCVRSASDAAIVLRVRSNLCNASEGPCALSAQQDALSPPTTLLTHAAPAATPGATVRPETSATNQSTCCSVCCSLAAFSVAREEELQKKQYLADSQRCWPPPLFITLMSLLEIAVFIYDYMTVKMSVIALRVPSATDVSANKPFASESSLIYRPDRRLEIWRYVSYMLLHANWFHLSFNVATQLVYGLPLEWVHGSARIAIIYLAGVFAGSLGTSVVDSDVCLVGASGGVYALLAAYFANILLNFGQMRYGVGQLVRVVVFVSCDLCYAVYNKYYNNNNNNNAVHAMNKTSPTISYIAHLSGALAGFTMGLLVLRNFDGSHAAPPTKMLRWLALSVYAAFMTFAIAFNLINTVTAQMLEAEGVEVEQRLLHNLGIT